jgi:predicted Zn-dependent peptidase
MKLLVYNRQDRGIIRRIERVTTALGKIMLKPVEDPNAVRTALNRCYAGETLVVFFVGDKKDMAVLESVERNFMDIKRVNYLCDKQPDFFVRAYKLFLRMATGNFDTDDLLLAAVNGILSNLMGTRRLMNEDTVTIHPDKYSRGGKNEKIFRP